MVRRSFAVATATLLLVLCHATSLMAQNRQSPVKANYSAELLTAGVDPQAPGSAWIGLDVRLGSGWHTYWRSAGDAGAPPEFDWSGSENVADVIVEWPAPKRITDAGIDTFGYADHVLFPVNVRLRDTAKPAHVSLKLALYVCSTICTRNDLQLEAAIRPDIHADDKQLIIDEWRDKVPREQAEDLSIRSVRLEQGPPARLRVSVIANPPLTKPDVFVDGDSAIVAGRPEFTAGYSGASFVTMPLQGVDAARPMGPLRITLVDGDRSVEAMLPQQGAPSLTSSAMVAPPAGANPPTPVSLWSMVALSLLGGLVLNFMPCVFPVLSLKLLSLLAHPSHDAGAIRVRFAASAGGVLASFLALAAVLATLKSTGAQIGWGIQFQQPLFLIGMAAALAVFAANLLGLFEIRLPWLLARPLSQATGGHSIASHFLNGFVMTLLATPCSAPFVGTAVAFALSQGPLYIFLIFAGLGVGMATPYLLLAAVPQVGRLFPRPGRWMLHVRAVAAAAIAATALWLLTVLAQVSGPQTALLVGAALGFSAWILAVIRQRFAHAIAGVLILMLTGFTALASYRQLQSPPVISQDVQWLPLASARIDAMVRNGQTVLVDIGAAWCITCKVNDALIIDSEAIHRRLKTDVTPVRGDWTKPDTSIAAYLQSFDRFGLPFNAVFGPGAPAGIVLPELLTQEAVLNAFATASHSTSQTE
jgi:suppressor for copper-sensitivity B